MFLIKYWKGLFVNHITPWWTMTVLGIFWKKLVKNGKKNFLRSINSKHSWGSNINIQTLSWFFSQRNPFSINNIKNTVMWLNFTLNFANFVIITILWVEDNLFYPLETVSVIKQDLVKKFPKYTQRIELQIIFNICVKFANFNSEKFH